MTRRLPFTPNSIIRNAIRNVWLRSRERAAAVKREKNTCELCGAKGSAAKGKEVKIVVHHLDGVDWAGLAEEIRRRILHDPSRLQVLCKECHDGFHKEGADA